MKLTTIATALSMLAAPALADDKSDLMSLLLTVHSSKSACGIEAPKALYDMLVLQAMEDSGVDRQRLMTVVDFTSYNLVNSMREAGNIGPYCAGIVMFYEEFKEGK